MGIAATQLRKEIGIIRIIFPEIKFLPLISKTSIPEEIILIILISFLTKNSMRAENKVPLAFGEGLGVRF